MKKLFFIILAAITVSTVFLCSCKQKPFGSGSTGNVDGQNNNSIDYTIIYYSVNDNKQIEVKEQYSGSSEFMMSHLLSRISELCGVSIDYNSVSDDAQTNTVTVDFASKGSPVSGLSSSSESAVLDSITETIFANYPDVDNVCFTCEQKEYNSGHVFLEKGEAYRTRTKDESDEQDKGPIVGRPDFYDAQPTNAEQ